MKKHLIGALGCLLVAACQSTGASGFMPRQFVGEPIGQMTHVYGEPVRVEALENGNQLFVYEAVSTEDMRQLSARDRSLIANAPRPQPYTMTQPVLNDDDVQIATQTTRFSELSNPAYAPVLCTIEVISNADLIIQSVSVANDLCLTIRS